jgi:hypothetical protein
MGIVSLESGGYREGTGRQWVREGEVEGTKGDSMTIGAVTQKDEQACWRYRRPLGTNFRLGVNVGGWLGLQGFEFGLSDHELSMNARTAGNSSTSIICPCPQTGHLRNEIPVSCSHRSR